MEHISTKRRSCASQHLVNGILVKKSAKYNSFSQKGDDTTNTTDNKCTVTQLTILYLYTNEKRLKISFA